MQMKNYMIGVLIVIILALSSLLYKQNKTSIPNRFPAFNKTVKSDVEFPLILYVFFSKKNCLDCLAVIRELNYLPHHFIVLGVVPKSELEDEQELRSITGAEFPIVSNEKYRKYIPFCGPSIVGVSPINGRIVFILPGVPGEKKYVLDFLESLYSKLYPIFSQQKFKK